ncbi:MAG: peptidase S41 [Lysobacteraceae bacterium]|nr:MAG: peptidase S41 [Xanthomonadaceae bacterium]
MQRIFGLILCLPLAVVSAKDVDQPIGGGLSLDDLRAYTDVISYVQSEYVEDVTTRKLFEASMRGMLIDLDPHSAWLSADAFQRFSNTTDGEYSGLGIEVQMQEGELHIVAPIDRSPAARVGIQPGDVIVAVDGRDLPAADLGAALALLRGETGDLVTLRIRRGDNEMDFAMVRETIEVDSVSSNRIDDQLYIRLSQFQADSADEMEDVIVEAMRTSPPNGIIIDLRNNPGGLLSAAIGVSDLFLADGVIVSTRGRLQESSVDYHASANRVAADVPIALLVDGGTASASEILAAALRDHERAVLIGSPTYGKGTVQSVLPLRNGSAIKLTTARYYRPNGEPIVEGGLSPDIAVDEGNDETDSALQIAQQWVEQSSIQ